MTTVEKKLHVLYRFFNANGELLYIGMTAHPGTRWQAHSKGKTWWTEIAQITVTHFPDRPSVERAEMEAIKKENPRYNIVRSRSDRPKLPSVRLPKTPKTPMQSAALLALVTASASFRVSLAEREQERQELADAIVEAFHADMAPSEIAAIAQYDRNHIGRIRQAAGIPPKRERDREAAETWFAGLNDADRAAFVANRRRLTAELAARAEATGAPVGHGGWGHDTPPTNYWLPPAYRRVLNEAANEQEQQP